MTCSLPLPWGLALVPHSHLPCGNTPETSAQCWLYGAMQAYFWAVVSFIICTSAFNRKKKMVIVMLLGKLCIRGKMSKCSQERVCKQCSLNCRGHRTRTPRTRAPSFPKPRLPLRPQRVKPANCLAVLLGQHEGWLPLPRSDMTAPIWCAAIKGLLRAERPDGFVMRTVASQNGFPLPLPLLPSAAGPRHSRLPACHSMY